MRKLLTTMLILSLVLAGCSNVDKKTGKDLGPCKGILESHKVGVKYEWNLTGLGSAVTSAFIFETWITPVIWALGWAKCPSEDQGSESTKQVIKQQPAQDVPKGYESERIDYSQYH